MKTMKITNRLIGMLCIAGLLLGCSEEEGLIGPIGPMGEQGIAGQEGPAGEDGIDGEALGVPGPEGDQGEQGPEGPAGADGEDGAQGPAGQQGPAGADGADGNTGPAGPQGQQGPAGPQGTPGQQGQQGPTGTANVIYSDWIASEFANNIVATGAGFDIDAPKLTKNIMDMGVILVYGRNLTISGFNYFALPFITSDDQHNYRVEKEKVLRITIASIDGGSIGSPFFEDYRYVLIPGGQPADNSGPGNIGSKTSSLEYSKMSYKEIAYLFDIKD